MLLRIGLAVGSSLPLPLPPIPPLLPHSCRLLSRRRALLLLPHASSALSSSAAMAAPTPAAPVARKVPRKLAEHGDVRVDDYYWLRDDARADPAVLAHLRAENDYTAALMSVEFLRLCCGGGCNVMGLRCIVWLHKLGTDQSDDTCLYHEKDDTFSLGLHASESKKYLFVGSGSKNTSFIFYLDIPSQSKELAVLTPRVDGIDTTASHRGNHFYITRRSEEFYNSELVACPLNNVAETTVLLPHRESVKIQDVQLFENHIAVYERENGLPKATVYRLPATGEAVGQLQGGRAIDFIDPAYAVEPEPSQFHSNVVRFYYSSMRTPPSIFDYDMDTGVSVLKKIDTVLGGFDVSNYVTERKWAAASDGTQIPMSVLYRKDMVKLDGSDPMLLYGYGSYEICIDPTFRGSRFSLVDRGFVYVIAHIRGGGEMGRNWYEDGKLLKKKNTFTDFIACAEHLIENKYCTKEKLCINGRSAGGLLMGAVLNMRPDLFKAAVAGVPFVDVLTTMLDPTIPLTTAEWEEWGDPRKEEYYYYMKSYSPVDNVKAQDYPHILVTAGLNDPRVMYSEPAKFVAKLRELKTDDNLLLFKCELGAGHFSKSGRFEKLREDAFTYAFILKALGMMTPTTASSL
ncbi:protease 2-like [Triticum dicoccoides]|uniref:protease 2-like n=1 Tax=Triticum dicoccoides TaxID=85692 RepID=UPI001891C4F7|nr:protease 2-like [Triticum dicoccoides]